MSFGRRLRLYLMGVLMGGVFVVFIFNDRLSILTDWLPNNRVINFISENYQGADSLAICQAKCLDLSLEGIENKISDGDVMFNMSDTKGSTKKYLLNFESEGVYTEMTFATTDSTARLLNVKQPERFITCHCP